MLKSSVAAVLIILAGIFICLAGGVEWGTFTCGLMSAVIIIIAAIAWLLLACWFRDQNGN